MDNGGLDGQGLHNGESFFLMKRQGRGDSFEFWQSEFYTMEFFSMMQQVFQNILVSDPPPVDPVGIHYQGFLKCSSFCGDCSQKSCRYDFLKTDCSIWQEGKEKYRLC